MILTGVQALLREIPGMDRAVGIAATVEDCQAEQNNLPRHLWICEAQGTAEPSEIAGSQFMRQCREQRFSIAAMVQDSTDRTGAAALEQMEILLDLVYARLLGQTPADGYDPLQYVADKCVLRAPPKLYWLVQFQSGNTLQNW
jgi:hypothetical protein